MVQHHFKLFIKSPQLSVLTELERVTMKCNDF